jgi:tungstate transport system ATP-binding protein
MIIMRNLRKRYGGATVLDIERLSFERGRLYVLVGHNGAGKTTLLKILAGLEVPDDDTGALTVDFNREDIVLCLQNPYMFLGTVGDNISYGLKARRIPFDAAHVRETIERFQLEPILGKNAKALSTGEAQRTSLARALVCRPGLLLLDEPTANVDPECVETVEEEIVRQNQSGVTVIVATHITELAYHLPCDIIRLEGGRVVSPEINNVFQGEIVHEGHESYVQLKGGLRFVCATQESGRRRVAIPAPDIVLSSSPLESSMRNQLEGTVKEVRQIGEIVEVSVDTGVVLKATVTPASSEKLGLKPGAPVVVSFKATAVKVF